MTFQKKENGELKRRIDKIEARNKRGTIASPIAGVALAGGTHYFASDWIKEKANAIEEIHHGLRVAASLTNIGKGDLDRADKYIRQSADNDLAQEYFRNLEAENRLITGSEEVLEVLQRGSLVFPGQETKLVIGLRDVKGKIIEGCTGLFEDREGKKKIALRNKSKYQENYNDLASVRIATVARREEIRRKMGDLASKLHKTELNAGQLTNEGVKALEDLAREYNKASEVLNEIRGMDVSDIYQESNSYASTLQKADNYRVEPFQPGAFADITISGTSILMGVLGYVMAKKVSRSYYAVSDTIKGGANTIRKIGENISRAYGGINYVLKELNNKTAKLKDREGNENEENKIT